MQSMVSFSIKSFSIKEKLFLLTVLLLNISLQVFVASKFTEYAIYILIFYLLFLISFVIYQNHIKDVPTLLLLINFLPLLYLSNDFHYSFVFELITAIPLLLLLMLSIIYFVYQEKDLSISTNLIFRISLERTLNTWVRKSFSIQGLFLFSHRDLR